MKLKKLYLCAFAFFLTKPIWAIEAFKSIGDDVDNGFTYILLFLIGYVLPIIAGIIFIVLRHVNKNPWYSFGIYVPAVWFIGAHYIINFWSEQTYESTGSSGFPFGLLIVAIIVVIHIFFDYEQVQQNRAKEN